MKCVFSRVDKWLESCQKVLKILNNNKNLGEEKIEWEQYLDIKSLVFRKTQQRNSYIKKTNKKRSFRINV